MLTTFYEVADMNLVKSEIKKLFVGSGICSYKETQNLKTFLGILKECLLLRFHCLDFTYKIRKNENTLIRTTEACKLALT